MEMSERHDLLRTLLLMGSQKLDHGLSSLSLAFSNYSWTFFCLLKLSPYWATTIPYISMPVLLVLSPLSVFFRHCSSEAGLVSPSQCYRYSKHNEIQIPVTWGGSHCLHPPFFSDANITLQVNDKCLYILILSHKNEEGIDFSALQLFLWSSTADS
jgi:hypothetical protein